MPRILIADDDQQIRRLIRRILEPHGHEVTEAADGREAMRLSGEPRPDVLIIDLIMPEMEGLETIREIRADCPHARIIAISGGGMAPSEAYLHLAERLGADVCLPKPFGPAQLVEAVNGLLEASPA
jgi:CheY-like chemotaxis protein